MKILVTAFKPFNKQLINHSSEVLKYIENVDKVILDVVYDDCYIKLSNMYNLNDYDLIIALGEARMRNILTVEKYAKNIASCSLPDNNNVLLKDHQIIENEQEILSTNLNLDLIKDIASISNDAGKFVCNNLYFHLLHNYPNKSLFIHIPECKGLDDYKSHANQIENIIKYLI